jgi:hypothetical protein
MILGLRMRSASFDIVRTLAYMVLHTFVLKILSIICDNVSANDTMVNKLELLRDQFNGQRLRTGCILQVRNLVAKAIIKHFNIPQSWQKEELNQEEKKL